MSADLAALVAEHGGVAAAATAVDVRREHLALILLGERPSWPDLRLALAAFVGMERAELFPEHAAWDAAFDAGMARSAAQGLPPHITDPVVLDRAAQLFADVRHPPAGRAQT